jgi:hypothetical protein
VVKSALAISSTVVNDLGMFRMKFAFTTGGYYISDEEALRSVHTMLVPGCTLIPWHTSILFIAIQFMMMRRSNTANSHFSEIHRFQDADKQISDPTRNLSLVRQRSTENFADDSSITRSEIGIPT